MKTKTRETAVDTELVDRINKMRADEAVRIVDAAVQDQSRRREVLRTNSSATLRQAWAVLKEKLTPNQKTNG